MTLTAALQEARTLGYQTRVETNANGHTALIGQESRPQLNTWERHFVNFENPDSLGRAITAWLERQDRK